MKPTVAIVGVGLIGGSLGRALRKSHRYRVLGISRKSATLREAVRVGALDEASKNISAVADADLIVVCTPVALIPPTIEKLLPFLKPSAIVTDAGSVKGDILRRVARWQKQGKLNFVGSHPLAGSHKTGVKASRSDLFFGSTVVLTPQGKTRLNAIAALWKATGASVVTLSADRHDQAVALISHLPHLVAHALVQSVSRRSDTPLLKRLMAGSFRDTTRVAAADPDQWDQIFTANQSAVKQALMQFRQALVRLERSMGRPSFRSLLKQSQKFRQPLFHGK